MEEDFHCPSPLYLQSANTQTPICKSNPKPNLSKCNRRPSSSITQQKNHTYNSPNIQIKEQILHHFTVKILQIRLLPKLRNNPKNID